MVLVPTQLVCHLQLGIPPSLDIKFLFLGLLLEDGHLLDECLLQLAIIAGVIYIGKEKVWWFQDHIYEFSKVDLKERKFFFIKTTDGSSWKYNSERISPYPNLLPQASQSCLVGLKCSSTSRASTPGI